MEQVTAEEIRDSLAASSGSFLGGEEWAST